MFSARCSTRLMPGVSNPSTNRYGSKIGDVYSVRWSICRSGDHPIGIVVDAPVYSRYPDGRWGCNRMRRTLTGLAAALRIISVFALVMIGFAHKPVFAYPTDAASSQYQLPDGTYASLCIDDHHNNQNAGKDLGCEACRLAGGVVLPTPVDQHGVALILSEEVKVFERRQRLSRSLYPPSSGPRAPPARQMFI